MRDASLISKNYPDVEDVLLKASRDADLPFGKSKFKFFHMLEKAVYDGNSPHEFRVNYGLPIRREIEKTRSVHIKYWELHYYHDGFDGPQTQWFDSRKDNEQHFYFTLRSLIDDKHYKLLEEADLIFKSPTLNIEAIKDVGHSNCKVDKYYTGKPNDQTAGGIDVIILEDKHDNFKTLRDIAPWEIFDCLTKKSGSVLPDYKPSDLPQIMFFGQSSTFIAKTDNVDSIVCLDKYTQLSTNEEGKILKIKGNLFLNEGAMVMPRRRRRDRDDCFIGRNTVFGNETIVNAESVGNNVFTGNNVWIGNGVVVNDCCIVTESVKLNEFNKLLAGQTITAKPPLFLNLLNNEETDLEMFYMLVKTRTEALKSGTLSLKLGF